MELPKLNKPAKPRDFTQLNITRLFIISIIFYIGAGAGFIREQLQNAGSMTLGAAISLIQQGMKEKNDDNRPESDGRQYNNPDEGSMW